MAEVNADRMGLETGHVVQEFGYDQDVSMELRDEIEAITGTTIEDEDFNDVCDVVIAWWRADDPDLTDLLVDALTALDGGGLVWLLTPTQGSPGAAHRAEIEDASRTAGLHATSTLVVAPGWVGIKLTPRGRAR